MARDDLQSCSNFDTVLEYFFEKKNPEIRHSVIDFVVVKCNLIGGICL